MDSNVQTKTPSNRRTKFVIIGLLVVICVLAVQLYRTNQIKKHLVIRKSFLINKLYECRVASEKTDTKLKERRAQSEQLKKTLTTKQEVYEELSKKYNDLEKSLDEKTQELSSLKKLADGQKNDLSTLKQDYDSAISSVKTMQGKLDETIKVCDKHKEATRSLNESATESVQQLEICEQDKANLERERKLWHEERAALERSQQSLQGKLEEMRKGAPARKTDVQMPRSIDQQPSMQSSAVKTTQLAKNTRSPGLDMVKKNLDDSKTLQSEGGSSQSTSKPNSSAQETIGVTSNFQATTQQNMATSTQSQNRKKRSRLF